MATNNAHKLEEVRRILPPTYEVLSMSDINCAADIEETGDTLEANSLIKAQYVWDHYHMDTISDDTGLFIEALGGEPGVYTARWAGDHGVDQNNRAKALRLLRSETNRKACFRTVVTLIKDGKTYQVEGRVDGTIATAESGEHGFGYDPIFIPEGFDKTFADLPSEVKNTISHRARAMQALKLLLESL